VTPAEYRETSAGVFSWFGDFDSLWVEHTTTDLDLVCWTRVFADGALWGVELVDQDGQVRARRYAPASGHTLGTSEAA
jgi:hypothetical protein